MLAWSPKHIFSILLEIDYLALSTLAPKGLGSYFVPVPTLATSSAVTQNALRS